MHVYITVTITSDYFCDRVSIWLLLLEMHNQATHHQMPVQCILLQQRKCALSSLDLFIKTCKTFDLIVFNSISVAASDASDTFAWFSFFGKCVNIIAPVLWARGSVAHNDPISRWRLQSMY